MRLLGIKSSTLLTVRSNWYYDNSGNNSAETAAPAGVGKKYRATNTHIAQGLSCRKKSLYSENESNRAEGKKSDPPEHISRKQEDHRHRTETPQHTNNFKNETFGIKRVFATEKRGGDVRAERARLFEPPPTIRAATLSGIPYRELLFYSLSGYKGV